MPIDFSRPKCVFSGCGHAPGYSKRWPLCPTHFNGVKPFELRDYQIEGVNAMYDGGRMMNTDAPGLGKTAQAAFAAVAPVLVLTPAYLVDQWAEWLRGEDEKSLERNGGTVWPNIDERHRVVVAKGSKWDKEDAIRERAEWTIINQESLSIDNLMYLEQDPADENAGQWSGILEEFRKEGFYKTIIIDEAHHLKSYKSIRAKAAARLCKDESLKVYLLTATPVKREIDDLYMQFHILHPTLFKSYWNFVDYYCVADTDRFGTKVYGAKKSMVKELEEVLDVVRIGRSYETAGRSLPPVIEKYVKIELPPAIRKMYDDAVNYWRIEELEQHYVNYMQVYHQLRQIVTGAFKYEAVAEILADEVRRAIVFSWYKSTAQEIWERFGPKSMELITGDIDVPERRKRAKTSLHVSGTISSMSEGIDLSDARVVIYAEEDWTPGSNYQAVSRVVRDRNTSDAGILAEPVLVYYVQCAKTIDEVIHRRSKRRAGTIKEVIREALYL